MSAHLRRRGRHAAPPQPLVSPTTLGPAVPAAVMSAALSASLTGATAYAAPALAATPAGRTAFPAVPNVTVHRHPATPFGLPSAIEGYAALRQQTHCDPTAKPGVVAFERIVLGTYPDTHSDGIVRACNVGGPSEHKEGRAWDWAVSAYDPHQAAEAAALLHWLLKPDAAGHRAAMARRLGIMYIIWDKHIWGSYDARAGWRTYTGAEAHTDHVHFSFSWAGARKHTSFWHRLHYRPVSPGVVGRYGGGMVIPGARGPQVRAIQHALNVRPVNGRYGARTEAAVAAFQRVRGLGVDGIVGPQTWHALGVGYHPPRVHRHHARHQRETAHGRPGVLGNRPPARPGSWARSHHWPTSAALRHARHHVVDLNAAGWPVGMVQVIVGVRADRYYGPHTRAAVQRFQRRQHLAADGVVGLRTWDKLSDRAHWVAAQHWQAERRAQVRYWTARRHATVARYSHLILRPGDHGPAVRWVQHALGVHPDGSFGPATTRAVERFQRAHRLLVDGQVGPHTWHALA